MSRPRHDEASTKTSSSARVSIRLPTARALPTSLCSRSTTRVPRSGNAQVTQARLTEQRPVTFVPVDFEAGHSLPERLRANGFDAARPALLSWLGMTVYLSRTAHAAGLFGIDNHDPARCDRRPTVAAGRRTAAHRTVGAHLRGRRPYPGRRRALIRLGAHQRSGRRRLESPARYEPGAIERGTPSCLPFGMGMFSRPRSSRLSAVATIASSPDGARPESPTRR